MMFRGKRRLKFCFNILLLCSLGLVGFLRNAPMAKAQEGEDAGKSRLIISSADTSSAPTIVLRTYGLDGDGNALVLTGDALIVRHDGQEVDDVEVAGSHPAGTLTIFIVDIPPGVSGQLPLIQQTIEQYASPPEMVEQVDYISIYQVGETEAVQLLPPTTFFNSIRNFFAAPLEPQAGPTALVDSLGRLLEKVEMLKPRADMHTSLVVLTDGTDAISSQFTLGEVGPKADALGIPIHTIWLENEELQSFSQEAGLDYLAQLSAASRGVAARLDQPEAIRSTWNRIAGFRDHALVQYRPEGLTGGDYEVQLALRDDPTVQAATRIAVSSASPSVAIDLSPESRVITLESLEEPVELALSASVNWLDGVERKLESAELLVNGLSVQDIRVRDLDRFTVEVSNFNYGSNMIQIAVEDELGQTGTSPPLTMTVLEGSTAVPEEILAESSLFGTLLRLGLACLISLVLVGLLGWLVMTVRRRGWFDRHGRPKRGSWSQSRSGSLAPESLVREPETAGAAETTPFSTGLARAYLEILQAVTRMPPLAELNAAEHRIGRSRLQADIVFENDISVSPLHAKIILEGSDYRIYDAGSAAGTLVNGQAVMDYGRQLIEGDEIILGEAVMRYRQP